MQNKSQTSREVFLEPDVVEARWKRVYRVGAVCVFGAVFVMVSEILLSAMADGGRTPLSIAE